MEVERRDIRVVGREGDSIKVAVLWQRKLMMVYESGSITKGEGGEDILTLGKTVIRK